MIRVFEYVFDFICEIDTDTPFPTVRLFRTAFRNVSEDAANQTERVPFVLLFCCWSGGPESTVFMLHFWAWHVT